jgi:hypothetical protein
MLCRRSLRLASGCCRCYHPLLSAAIPGNGWADVTRLCAWCENLIPPSARRDVVCCSVRRYGGFKLDKRDPEDAAQLRLCAVDRG